MIQVWKMKISTSLRFYLDEVLHEYLQEDIIRKKNIISFFTSKNQIILNLVCKSFLVLASIKDDSGITNFSLRRSLFPFSLFFISVCGEVYLNRFK